MEVLVSRGTRRHEENEKAFRDLGYRITWDNWGHTGDIGDKTRKGEE